MTREKHAELVVLAAASIYDGYHLKRGGGELRYLAVEEGIRLVAEALRRLDIEVEGSTRYKAREISEVQR